ncbi:MAG: ribonuclease HI family protein [Planctomycetes bacterium]|nr:ribonuclease HI family protein [Planctomycetota bacterium]
MEPVIVHIDGAARGNHGPAAFAFVIQSPGQPPVEEHGKLGDTTNNIAEYTALLRALEKAATLSLKHLHVHSDSELLVKQMNGEYRVKNADLKELYDQAQELLDEFQHVKITHVRRENNKRADQLCNIALDGDKPKAATKPRKEASHAKSDPAAVRDDCLVCLESARQSWIANDPRAPSAAQVWEQLWSVLEEGGVLKKK